ncbi:hypothetical protein VNO78_11795 [Psophocarpus tetragonolobus]|uniref:Uncharacterized protein n=1 Tax=Psophocarpus tetragonolobus TaxID=3891 RepID=A0AAN9XP19_PSOTE
MSTSIRISTLHGYTSPHQWSKPHHHRFYSKTSCSKFHNPRSLFPAYEIRSVSHSHLRKVGFDFAGKRCQLWRLRKVKFFIDWSFCYRYSTACLLAFNSDFSLEGFPSPNGIGSFISDQLIVAGF